MTTVSSGRCLLYSRRPLSGLLRSFSAASPSLDSEEVKKFGDLSSQWMDERGPFKALHSLNKLRVPWIIQNIGKKEVRSSTSILDVGSGGGLLSVPLARSGFKVTGIDATPEAVSAAEGVLETPALRKSGVAARISYKNTTAEEFANNHENAFDAVVASEIAEHVADVPSFVGACARMARPGAPLFFTTINRTLLSRITAVWLAEEVLRVVPRGVHDWNKFITPDELSEILRENGCRVRAVNGFIYHPLGNFWEWTSNSWMNYALMAEKM